jgi:hypothetical protein
VSDGVDENRRFSSANRNASRSDDVDESRRLSSANQKSSISDDADSTTRDGRSVHPNTDPNRRRAVLATLPFLLLGTAVVLLSLEFAPQPLWVFLLVPPVAFMSVLTYLAFRSDFLDGR